MDSKEKEELAAKLRQALEELEIDDKRCCITSPKSPHFWWLFGLMVAAILALIAAFIFKIELTDGDIANYVSAFSVLLSILLSIFAIQYTYHSNAQVERQFNDINRAAHNIIETSKELKATESLLKDAIDKIHAHLKNNDIKIDKLTTNVNNLQGQLRGNDLNWNKKPEIATESRESANNSSPDTTASGSTAATDADADGSDK